MTVTCNIMSYRYGHLTAHCVDSILCQSRPFDVVRVFDDGVGDCMHIAKLYPEVELIQRNTNFGVTANFEDALASTETDYVIFLGADNWLRADALELLTTALPSDIVCYHIALTGTERERFARSRDADAIHEGLRIWKFPESVTVAQMRKGNRVHGSSLYRVAAGKAAGYRHMGPVENPQEDWGLFTQMLQNGARYSLVPHPLLYYRRHRENFIDYQ
jgi:glycosyltransferase involved in cell wall biosynthesis